MDIDIGQIVSRFENIDRKLEKLDSRFEYDSDVTIVAQHINSDMDREENAKRLAERIVHDELRLADVRVVRAKRLVRRNGRPG